MENRPFGRLNGTGSISKTAGTLRSIDQVKNLLLDDFCCRLMILGGNENDLIIPVEAELIRSYRPAWNSIIDGFGNHDPGKGRYDQAKSEWDILHPGRYWAQRLTGPSPNLADIMEKLRRTKII
jgi:hypothetical protein